MNSNKGAEAYVYNHLLLGISCIIKERRKKSYRAEMLDQMLRVSRTKSEARIMIYAYKNNIPIPRLLFVSKYAIAMERLNGEILTDLKITKEDMLQAGACLGMLHNIDIAHGDFTPANLIKCDSKIFVIDFGLSEITNQIESKALDILLMKRSIPPSFFKVFIQGYKSKSTSYDTIMLKLTELLNKGRYQLRTLDTI